MNQYKQQLIDQGYQLKHDGNGNYRVCGFNGLIIKDDYWYQHSTGLKGHFSQIHHPLKTSPFKADTAISNKRFNLKTNFISDPEHNRPIKNLLDLSNESIVYLNTYRFIDKELISSLCKAQFLQEDNKGRLNFIGYDPSGNIRCISRRECSNHPKAFKGEEQHSDKHYSFQIKSQQSPCSLFLCEGPIDALSIACLNHRRHKSGYFTSNIIATCGSPHHNLKKRVHQLKPSKIYMVFDNDEAGRSMDHQARTLLKTSIPIQTISYPYGKDPNDWLIHRIKNNIN